jgi:type II secretory pathway component HofQ
MKMALLLFVLGSTSAFALEPKQKQAPAPGSERKVETPSGQKAPEVQRKRYTGRRVDLDFKDADIHNILRLLADVGQVNIMTAEEIKGEVTIKMRDVPWDQALDVVLRGQNLAYDRDGDTIRIWKKAP